MKRLYRHTKLDAVGAASTWFDSLDKTLVAQLELNPTHEGQNLLVEYWGTAAERDADLAEAAAPEKPEQPAATPGHERQMPGENGYPPLHTHVIFVRGPQNLAGFVDYVDERGSYLLADGLRNAAWHGSVAKAQDAIKRILAHDNGKVNPKMAPDFYVLTLESMHPADLYNER